MNNSADTLSEQLSAFMDGELPEAEARFLQRRLEHDADLRDKWARLQLAAICIKGQPWRLMSETLCQQVNAEIARMSTTRGHRPLLRWAMVASVAALALVFAPRLMQNNAPDSATLSAKAGTTVPDHILASPASADLVAVRSSAETTATSAGTISAPPLASGSDFIKSNPEASAKSSPMPLSAQSPTDFPLIDSGDKRSWPRSELIGAANDPAIEAYLVRHNQMLANDGLGGFVPYVDVVASDQSATISEQDVPRQDGEASQQ